MCREKNAYVLGRILGGRFSVVNQVTIDYILGKPPTGKKKEEKDQSSAIKSSGCCPSKKYVDDFCLCVPRPTLHPDPDVIVLCFSAVDSSSIQELETEIWPEITQKFDNVPIILVATKCDARQEDEEQFWPIDGNLLHKSK